MTHRPKALWLDVAFDSTDYVAIVGYRAAAGPVARRRCGSPPDARRGPPTTAVRYGLITTVGAATARYSGNSPAKQGPSGFPGGCTGVAGVPRSARAGAFADLATAFMGECDLVTVPRYQPGDTSRQAIP